MACSPWENRSHARIGETCISDILTSFFDTFQRRKANVRIAARDMQFPAVSAYCCAVVIFKTEMPGNAGVLSTITSESQTI